VVKPLRVRSHQNVTEIFLQWNAPPHTSLKTQETIIILGWALHTYTLYNPYLAPQISTFLEPSKAQSLGKGLGVKTRFLKNWLQQKIPTGARRE
jgi:hypothetical protein